MPASARSWPARRRSDRPRSAGVIAGSRAIRHNRAFRWRHIAPTSVIAARRVTIGAWMTQTLRRRVLALGLLAMPGASVTRGALVQGALSPQDMALVDQAVAYLQSLGEAKGPCVQTDPRG